MAKNSKHRSRLLIIAAIITAVIICLAFAACNKEQGNEPGKTDKPTDVPAVTDAVTQAPVVTDAPTEKPTAAPTAAPTEVPDPTEYPYEGMPEPYFDLAFSKNDAFDALGNNDYVVLFPRESGASKSPASTAPTKTTICSYSLTNMSQTSPAS